MCTADAVAGGGAFWRSLEKFSAAAAAAAAVVEVAVEAAAEK